MDTTHITQQSNFTRNILSYSHLTLFLSLVLSHSPSLSFYLTPSLSHSVSLTPSLSVSLSLSLSLSLRENQDMGGGQSVLFTTDPRIVRNEREKVGE